MATEKRLIDANALEKALRTDKGADALGHSVVKLLKIDAIIEEQPEVDAVEVVHGLWIDLGRNYYTVVSQCSVCGAKYDFRSPYCPNCGAKMEGSVKNA